LRLIPQARALSLNLVTNLRGEESDFVGICPRLRFGPDRGTAIRRGKLLGFRRDTNAQRITLGVL
jgi:hypothetical protein